MRVFIDFPYVVKDTSEFVVVMRIKGLESSDSRYSIPLLACPMMSVSMRWIVKNLSSSSLKLKVVHF
jgi:hypothetical protein